MSLHHDSNDSRTGPRGPTDDPAGTSVAARPPRSDAQTGRLYLWSGSCRGLAPSTSHHAPVSRFHHCWSEGTVGAGLPGRRLQSLASSISGQGADLQLLRPWVMERFRASGEVLNRDARGDVGGVLGMCSTTAMATGSGDCSESVAGGRCGAWPPTWGIPLRSSCLADTRRAMGRCRRVSISSSLLGTTRVSTSVNLIWKDDPLEDSDKLSYLRSLSRRSFTIWSPTLPSSLLWLMRSRRLPDRQVPT